MNIDHIMLRLGEITLKGRNRGRFEDQALRHVKRAVAAFEAVTVRREYGRLYLDLNGEAYEPVAEALRKVFGLVSFSPVIQVKPELEAIQEAALETIRRMNPRPRTFKVAIRRVNKAFPYDTPSLNPLIGGYVLRNVPDLKVDVRHPDVTLQVEIRDQFAYVYSEVVPGLGGFPVGSNGKGMLMLSGGIDSPVAGWLSMRRGLEVEAVHFHSMPYTSERAKQKVIDLASVLSRYAPGEITLHLVPFTDIQMKLKQVAQEHLLITMMRRSMFRITEQLAAKRKARAILTGESLGQVASQTLGSLQAIGSVVSLPVLRPLIMMDKTEIMKIANHIGTFDISILPYEDCCTLFVPKSPSTNPNRSVVESHEKRWDWLKEMEEQAVEQTERLYISPSGVRTSSRGRAARKQAELEELF